MNAVLQRLFRLTLAKSLGCSLSWSILVAAYITSAQPNNNPTQLAPQWEGRYLIFNDAAAAKALARGAIVVQETKGLKAVTCSPAVAAELSLVEDIRVQAVDLTANTQVLASSAQDIGLTGHGRRIVVLDSGYNYNHPELRSSYLGGKDLIHNDDDPFDDNGHGSHVAGIITGDGVDPRASGIAPDAGITAGKVLDSSGNGYISDIVAGIYWAVDGPDGYYGTADDFHADAINISIGTTGTDMYPSIFCDGAFPSLTAAIKYARDHGIPVVIAAGNNGVNGVSMPGCVSYALTVGAIDRSNVLANFSGVGPAVDIVAPGMALYSAALGTNYKSLNGTSHATPVVSGAIALFKEAFPNASVDDVENTLLTTAVHLGWLGKDSRYGWGRLDVYRALGGLTASLAKISLSVTRSNDQLVISWPMIPPGFVLQGTSRPDETANGWYTLTNAVVPVGTRNTTTLPIPTMHQFYRLKWE